MSFLHLTNILYQGQWHNEFKTIRMAKERFNLHHKNIKSKETNGEIFKKIINEINIRIQSQNVPNEKKILKEVN